jgi:Uma2 family endonuclease
MSSTVEHSEAGSLHIRLSPVITMTDDQFFEFCLLNRDLRIERTSEGDLIVMPPTGGRTGNRNLKVTMQLGVWAERDGTGVAFDSSTGFRLPNGADVSPDAAWVHRSRLAALSETQRERFLPLCPDFVLELRSPSDKLKPLKRKMLEYVAEGCRLGLLLDPAKRRVFVYRPGKAVEELGDVESVSGDPELPAFVLNLSGIWEPDI